jgi:hypothetical protein
MTPIIAKIDALLAGITRADIQALAPVHRFRLACALRRIADIADPRPEPPRPTSGVLADLADGARVS